MNSDGVIAGVGYGGLTDKYDVKILICYLLFSLNQPLTKPQLDFVFQDGQYANYFSFCDAFAELIASKHITCDDDKVLTLNELGAQTAKKLFTNLPRSLCDNIVDAAMCLFANLKNERENEVNIFKYQNGFRVSCVIHDVDFDLLSFDVYLPDIQQAEKIKTRFLENPTLLYQKLMNFLVFD